MKNLKDLLHTGTPTAANPYAGRHFYRNHYRMAPGPDRRETAMYLNAGVFVPNHPNPALRTPITDAMRVAAGMQPAKPESLKARRRRLSK